MHRIFKEKTCKKEQSDNSDKSISSSLKGMKAKEEEDTTSVASTTVIVIPTSISHPSFQLKTYPQAWFALLLLVLLRTAVSVFQFTFSVIPSMTAQFFHVSMSAVNWLATVQCIVYVIVSFFTGFIFEKLGVKRSVNIAYITYNHVFFLFRKKKN